jgi:hypothetical protein
MREDEVDTSDLIVAFRSAKGRLPQEPTFRGAKGDNPFAERKGDM